MSSDSKALQRQVPGLPGVVSGHLSLLGAKGNKFRSNAAQAFAASLKFLRLDRCAALRTIRRQAQYADEMVQPLRLTWTRPWNGPCFGPRFNC